MPDDYHPGKMREWDMFTHAVVFKSQSWTMSEYPYPVTLDWARRPDNEKWNEICAWTIEHFGLPGVRYRTEVSTQRMTWYFETQEDQLMMIVAWGNDTERT